MRDAVFEVHEKAVVMDGHGSRLTLPNPCKAHQGGSDLVPWNIARGPLWMFR
jgi:hypothetical protein